MGRRHGLGVESHRFRHMKRVSGVTSSANNLPNLQAALVDPHSTRPIREPQKSLKMAWHSPSSSARKLLGTVPQQIRKEI